MDTAVTLKFPQVPGADTRPPTPAQLAANAVLEEFVAVHCPPVSEEHAAQQRAALRKLHELFKAWCGAPFHMFVSGSYRLGVHSADAGSTVPRCASCATGPRRVVCTPTKAATWAA